MKRTLAQKAFGLCKKPALQLAHNYLDSLADGAAPRDYDPILTTIDAAKAAYLTFLGRLEQTALGSSTPPNGSPTSVRLSIETTTGITSASHPDRTVLLSVQLVDVPAPAVKITYQSQAFHVPLTAFGSQWMRLSSKTSKALPLRIRRPIPEQKTIDVGFD